MYGGNGDDDLDGGAGGDTLRGGRGEDDMHQLRCSLS
jgi:Ca2+-binding RTX toxin-like protein